MKRSLSFLTGLAFAALLYSCSKSNEADLTQTTPPPTGGGTNCDTVNMKFAANVKPILQANCYPCHSNANYTISGVKLEDYADVKARAGNGMLMGVITHAAGYPAMPQGGAKLSDCNINKIKAWIDRGTLDN